VLKLDARFLFQEKRNCAATAQDDLLTTAMKSSLKYARHIFAFLLVFLACVSNARHKDDLAEHGDAVRPGRGGECDAGVGRVVQVRRERIHYGHSFL